MPRPSLRQSIADSIDAPPEALPYIPEVFADLASLGSSPRQVTTWLAALNLGPRHRVLDLACGKGAVSVALARRFACRVTAVDAFPPFIEAATALAARQRVAHLCQFHIADVRKPLPKPQRFDAALMLGLFDLETAAAILRPQVRPGGHYLLDDAISLDPHPAADDAPLTRAEARFLLEETGDRVVRELVFTPARVRQIESRLFAAMQRRITAITRRDPSARKPLAELLRRQRAAAADLVGPVRPALWLVRKRSR